MLLVRRLRWQTLPCHPLLKSKARHMTLQQIQREVRTITHEDRLALSAYLRHLSRAGTENNQRWLDVTVERMAKGEKVTRAKVQRLHKSVKAAGV